MMTPHPGVRKRTRQRRKQISLVRRTRLKTEQTIRNVFSNSEATLGKRRTLAFDYFFFLNFEGS